jgi:hypothetical protein
MEEGNVHVCCVYCVYSSSGGIFCVPGVDDCPRVLIGWRRGSHVDWLAGSPNRSVIGKVGSVMGNLCSYLLTIPCKKVEREVDLPYYLHIRTVWFRSISNRNMP